MTPKTEPIVIAPAEDLYSPEITIEVTPEERQALATLTAMHGWNVLLRILTMQIRVFENMLGDVSLSSEIKLSILARWNATKDVFTAIQQWPTKAAAPDDASSGMSGASHAKTLSRMPPPPPQMM
jgi:hypothetical protein